MHESSHIKEKVYIFATVKKEMFVRLLILQIFANRINWQFEILNAYRKVQDNYYIRKIKNTRNFIFKK